MDNFQGKARNRFDAGLINANKFISMVIGIHQNSDVDILVAFEPDQKTFDNFMDLSFFLEDLLGRPVDLVTVEALSPYIGLHILEEVEYVAIDP